MAKQVQDTQNNVRLTRLRREYGDDIRARQVMGYEDPFARFAKFFVYTPIYIIAVVVTHLTSIIMWALRIKGESTDIQRAKDLAYHARISGMIQRIHEANGNDKGM